MNTNTILSGNVARKRVVLAANYFIALTSFSTSYINFKVGGYPVLASIQAIVVFISFYIIFKIHRDKLRRSHSIITSILYMFLVIYATYMSDLDSGIGAWGMTLPILFYLANSLRSGFIFSLIYMLIYLWILAGVYDVDYTENIKPFANFILAYLIIWGIAHVYEKNRVNSQIQLTILALKDPLTNTNNRLALKHDFQQIIEDKKGVGLALLDIDHFKKINDTYGHEVGDDILVQLAGLFQQKVTEKNVYRLGGEEFVLLFEENEEKALAVLDIIRTETAQQVFECAGGHKISMTFSGGFVYFATEILQEPLSLSKMLRIADEFLYQAKNKGRNKIIYTEQ